jgi:hypothetical protein
MLGWAKLLGGPWGYLIVAVSAAVAAGFIVQTIADASYLSLELRHEKAKVEQRDTYLMNLEAFELKRQNAEGKTAAALKELGERRATDALNLKQTLVQESNKDETLKACLSYSIPDELLHQLP